jgi:hypothetical protein
MNISNLLVYALVIFIISYGTGYMFGGHARAKQIVAWELKKLAKFGRWLLKQTFRIIADMCHWVHDRL